MEETTDKKALLNELRIDRQTTSGRPARPVWWLVAIAVIGGGSFVAWTFGVPMLSAAEVQVETVLAQAVVDAAAGDSVLDATGYVVARRQATVSSKTTGKVLEVLIEEGMTVEQGQLLAVLDDSIPKARLRLAESQLEASRAALEEIRVNIRQAELDLERTRNLAGRQLVSQAELDSDELSLEGLQARLSRTERDIVVAERSLAVQRQQLEDMEIRAPFAGVVIAKAAQPGEMISPVSAGGGFTRTGICTIVDMDSLEVEVDVNEAYINRVYAKQPATATLNAYPDFDIPAEVIATIPAADRNKATVRVRIGFLQRDPRILPDMGVKVAFLEEREEPSESASPSTESAARIAVPKTAVGDEDGQRFVWVVRDDVAERRQVTVGESLGSRLHIAEGLQAGERVVAVLTDAALAQLTDGVRIVADQRGGA